MKSICQIELLSPSTRRVLAGLALFMGLHCLSSPVIAFTDQSLPIKAVGFRSGKITAVNQPTFQIDGRIYGLTQDAVILDETGNQLDAGYISVDLEAKFHVKNDQSDKIDKMILILPR